MPRRIGNPSARGQHFIREWREFRSLTQEQLAEAVGTTKASISRIEDHLTGYTQDSLELIARVLWVHPSILLARRPRPEDALEPPPPLPDAISPQNAPAAFLGRLRAFPHFFPHFSHTFSHTLEKNVAFNVPTPLTNPLRLK